MYHKIDLYCHQEPKVLDTYFVIKVKEQHKSLSYGK